MAVSMTDTAYFLFSLDTELATGYFDEDAARHRLFSEDGLEERRRIARVLALCEQYDIHATWAVVGHLFFNRCEYCPDCPISHWQGKYASYDEAYGTDHPLWYGDDVVRLIQQSTVEQEIAFHGHTHEPFDSISAAAAMLEISEWKRLAQRFGIDAVSIVFPRDRAGHLSLLSQHGFSNYRADVVEPLLIRNRYFGRYVKTLDHIIGFSTAPTYSLQEIDDDGLLRLSASQHLFGFNHGVDSILDRLGLSTLRLRRINRGIKRAVGRKHMFHLWAHPWEFRTKDDLYKLEHIFQTVRRFTETGQMQSVTMAEMDAIIRTQDRNGN
jgi:hypothetical protein